KRGNTKQARGQSDCESFHGNFLLTVQAGVVPDQHTRPGLQTVNARANASDRSVAIPASVAFSWSLRILLGLGEETATIELTGPPSDSRRVAYVIRKGRGRLRRA